MFGIYGWQQHLDRDKWYAVSGHKLTNNLKYCGGELLHFQANIPITWWYSNQYFLPKLCFLGISKPIFHWEHKDLYHLHQMSQSANLTIYLQYTWVFLGMIWFLILFLYYTLSEWIPLWMSSGFCQQHWLRTTTTETNSVSKEAS